MHINDKHLIALIYKELVQIDVTIDESTGRMGERFKGYVCHRKILKWPTKTYEMLIS